MTLIQATLIATVTAFWGPIGPQKPIQVHIAPSFKVKDIGGNVVAESAYKNRTTVLFSFCGCKECRLMAEQWAKSSPHQGIQTFVCYSGSAKEVKQMARMWPGKKDSATFLVDPQFQIAEKYLALPCPAMFVIDSKGLMRYSSKQTNGETESNASLITEQAFDVIKGIRSGQPVTVSIDRPKIIPPLVAVTNGECRAKDNQTLMRSFHPAHIDKGQILEEFFLYRNTSRSAVEIDSVLSSCGCEEAGVMVDGKINRSATVVAGKTAKIRVRVKIPPQFGGDKTVQVWLMGKNAEMPIGNIQIEIHGSS